jgi:hypothetical protein
VETVRAAAGENWERRGRRVERRVGGEVVD